MIVKQLILYLDDSLRLWRLLQFGFARKIIIFIQRLTQQRHIDDNEVVSHYPLR